MVKHFRNNLCTSRYMFSFLNKLDLRQLLALWGRLGSPHELVTVGGVGTACASLIQATVELPFAGRVNVAGEMV